MKFTVLSGDLATALRHAAAVIPARPQVEALRYARIVAGSNGLVVTATDHDRWLDISALANVTEPGTVRLEARPLYDIVRARPPGKPLEFERTDSGAVMRADGAVLNLSTIPAEQFFSQPDIGKVETRCVIPASQLVKLIDKTRFALSTEVPRKYLNLIHFHTARGRGGQRVLRAVATDAFRLARIDVPLPANAEGLRTFDIHRENIPVLLGLLRTLKSGDVTIESYASTSFVRLICGNATLTFRAPSTPFVDYEKVLPEDLGRGIVFDTEALIETVKAAIKADGSRHKKWHKVIVSIHVDGFVARLDLMDGGKAVTATFPLIVRPATEREKAQAKVTFDARYLLSVLDAIDSREVRMQAFDDKNWEKPVLFRELSRGIEDDTVLYVVMPCRV